MSNANRLQKSDHRGQPLKVRGTFNESGANAVCFDLCNLTSDLCNLPVNCA